MELAILHVWTGIGIQRGDTDKTKETLQERAHACIQTLIQFNVIEGVLIFTENYKTFTENRNISFSNCIISCE